MGNQNDITAESVELNTKDGVAFIEQASPLTRLHYFDGKFLKADALAQEQAYHRTQVQLANVAGGWGVVHGLGVGLSGDQLTVGGGLAITPAGHFVLTVGDVQAKIADLLKLAVPTPAIVGNTEPGPCLSPGTNGGVTETAALGLYEVTVGPVEGLCGNEAVYGALCESACVSDSRHPYWREGLVLRLRPITLNLPTSSKVPFSTTHLRNRVASAYFAIEPGSTNSALSGSGLANGLWCQPASLYGRDEVVIGLLVREAGSNRVLDAWSGRRERMAAQARGYWQGRMGMRPWNVYLAQILQFQCQLSGVFDATDVVVQTPDNCDELRSLLDQTRKEIAALHKKYSESAGKIAEHFNAKPTPAEAKKLADDVKGSYAELYELSEKLSGVEVGQGALPKNRLLLNNGFVQLPPAGYLPVQPGKTLLSDQLSRLFGEGVRLHYRAARADVLPHLLEEAQHMERISLTQGIDHPDALEDVEIFVPDGLVIAKDAKATGLWWDTSVKSLAGKLFGVFGKKGGGTEKQSLRDAGTRLSESQDLTGLSRTESREDGSFGLTLVVATNPDVLAGDTGYPEDGPIAMPAPTAFYTLKAYRPLSDTMAGFLGNDTNGGDTLGNDTLPGHDRDDEAEGITAYLAADIATDPFDLSVGDETSFKAELRLLTRSQVIDQSYDSHQLGNGFMFKTRSQAVAGRVTGTLSVLNRQTLSKGRTLLLVELIGSATSTMYTDGEEPVDDDGSLKTRLSLVRRGDGSTGLLLIDDALHDKRLPPIALDWDGAPKVATVRVERPTYYGGNDTNTGGQDTVFHGQDTLHQGQDTNTGVYQANEMIDLARLRALGQAPLPSSAIGSDALSSLAALSDATEDPAFLVRARKRLFPTLDTSSDVQIQAVLDWVLFRRLRPTFCDPVCVAPAKPEVEAFQVWHLKVESPKQLKHLQTALDRGDWQVLAEFKVQPVGVLRYRDDNTEPEESTARVLAMWQQAKPGAKVLLAREWETHPATGQGWQNHGRLRAMLQRIGTLTQPPKRGDGVIATLPEVPSTLSLGALDGGMLVVTGGEVATDTSKHRVIFMSLSTWSDLESLFKSKPDSGWKTLLKTLTSTDADHPITDLTVDIAGNALTPEANKRLADTIGEFQAKLIARQSPGGHTYARDAVRIDGAVIDAGEDPAARHQSVVNSVAANDIALFKLTKTDDLGDGAHVASFIVLREIFAQ